MGLLASEHGIEIIKKKHSDKEFLSNFLFHSRAPDWRSAFDWEDLRGRFKWVINGPRVRSPYEQLRLRRLCAQRSYRQRMAHLGTLAWGNVSWTVLPLQSARSIWARLLVYTVINKTLQTWTLVMTQLLTIGAVYGRSWTVELTRLWYFLLSSCSIHIHIIMLYAPINILFCHDKQFLLWLIIITIRTAFT